MLASSLWDLLFSFWNTREGVSAGASFVEDAAESAASPLNAAILLFGQLKTAAARCQQIVAALPRLMPASAAEVVEYGLAVKVVELHALSKLSLLGIIEV